MTILTKNTDTGSQRFTGYWIPMLSVLTIAPATAWTSVSYDRRLTAEPLLPVISVKPVAGLPGSEWAQGEQPGLGVSRRCGTVYANEINIDRYDAFTNCHRKGKKFLKKIICIYHNVEGGFFPLSIHWLFGNVLLRHVNFVRTLLPRSSSSIYFCVLHLLMRLKDATVDRTVNIIRIIYVNLYWYHTIDSVVIDEDSTFLGSETMSAENFYQSADKLFFQAYKEVMRKYVYCSS